MATAPTPYRPRAAGRAPRRPSATQRGYQGDGGQWKRLSRTTRKHNRDTILCDWCKEEGRATHSDVADHIIPHRGHGDPLLLDPANVRGLCHAHHQRKTAKQDDQIRAEFDRLIASGTAYEAARDEVIRAWRSRVA